MSCTLILRQLEKEEEEKKKEEEEENIANKKCVLDKSMINKGE